MTDTPVENTAPVETVENTAPVLRDLLSEDLKQIKSLENYDTVDAMAKSLLSAQEMVGKRVKDLSADELKSLDKKFGAPESIEGYSFEASEAFKKEALDMGLSYNQALRMNELNTTRNQASEKEAEMALTERADEFNKALEAEYGTKIEARLDLARKAALELGGEDLQASLVGKDGVGDMKLIKAMSEAGKRIFDHESVATDRVTKFGLTPSEAENEIALLKNNPEFQSAYYGNNSDARKAAVDKISKLFKIVYPG